MCVSWRPSPARSRRSASTARSSSPARMVSTRSPRRAHDRYRGQRRGAQPLHAHARAMSASSEDAAAPTGPPDGRHARGERRRHARHPRGERPAGDSGDAVELAVINAGAAIYAAGRADSIADGVGAAREAHRRRRAARALERYVQASNSHAPGGPADEHPQRATPCSSRILRSTREDSSGASASVPLPSSSGGPPSAARRRGRRRPGRLTRALRGARDRGDRRVQAPLALGRRPAPKAPRRPRSSAHMSAVAPAPLSVLTEEANFAGSLEDLARRPRRQRAADSAQGLHPRPLPAARGASRGADAVLLIVAALEPASSPRCTTHAIALGLDVLVEVHDRSELDAALALGARDRRDQQPRSARLQRRRRAHRAADAR